MSIGARGRTALALVGSGALGCAGGGPSSGAEYGLVELSVVEGEVAQVGLPGAEARALLSVTEDDEEGWTGSITFIDGGLVAGMDPAGWEGPFVLRGTCEDEVCHFTYGDVEGLATESEGPDLSLELDARLNGTAVEGELTEVARVFGVEQGRAVLGLEGFLVGPASFEPGSFPVTTWRNGQCGDWAGADDTIEIDFDSSGRGVLRDTAGLIADSEGVIELPGVASGEHFFGYHAHSRVIEDADQGSQCLDEAVWWADVAVTEAGLSGLLSFLWRRHDGDGEYACALPDVDCSAVFVLDPA